jgi:DnaJ-class molecular chaperone
MSRWHRNHPELVGTSADPWTIHEDYRRLVERVAIDVCARCGGSGEIHFNRTGRSDPHRDPQWDDSATCPDCDGTGTA